MSTDDFVHFHTHSDRSTLDGCGKLEDYVKVAVGREHRAIAFTEHGTMRGIYDLAVAAGDKIKPIYGIEAYICLNMHRKGLTEAEKDDALKLYGKKESKLALANKEDELGIKKRWHLSIWAKNQIGLKNLFKLSSRAWIEGFYYKPRIDLQALFEHREGLVIGTGCVNSPIASAWLEGRRHEAMEIAEILHEQFGSDMWLEVMPHVLGDGTQHEINALMRELRYTYPDCRLLATQDAHYIDPNDWEHHDVLLCIGTGKTMKDADRFRFDACGGFHFRTRAEMEDAFQAHRDYFEPELIKEALDSTLELADSISAKLDIDPLKCLLPPIDMPEVYAGNPFAYLKDLCVAGMEWRDIPGRAEVQAKRLGIDPAVMRTRYAKRLKHELSEIRAKKFDPYFLVVRDVYDWARKQKIACGPGRGSSAGSLAAFLLGITSVDPLEHNLIFERFISPARVDMPDIDMDFEDVRRGEIVEYLRQKYGVDKVAQIATLGRLSGKAVVKDVSRVFDVPFLEANIVTSEIMERSLGDARVHDCVEDSFKESERLKSFDENWPMVRHHASFLEGMVKTVGIHPAGVVTSPIPLIEVVPLETRKQKDAGEDAVIVTAIDMRSLQGLGLLKLDVLGLRNLTVLREAVDAVRAAHPDFADLDLELLPLDDGATLKMFTEQDFVGIFQFDTPASRRVCAGIEFTHFADIATMTALNRPGTSRSGLTEIYKARKKRGELGRDHFHPKITALTSDTLGVLVYQEHIMQIAVEVAGYSAVDADKMRKTIGYRLGEETMNKEREHFVTGCLKTTPDMDRAVAEKLMDTIAKSGAYLFNKSHSVAYGMIAYWCAWMKRRFPLEFYWGLLCNEREDVVMRRIARDAEKHGIKVLPPDVNVSRERFVIDRPNNAIRGSILDIKYVGEEAAKAIIGAQPFADFLDFVKRVPRQKVNKRAVESLAAAGAMNALVPNPRFLWSHIDDLWDLAKGIDEPKGAHKIEKLKRELARSPELLKWTPEEAAVAAAEVNPFCIHGHPIEPLVEFARKHVPGEIFELDDPTLWDQPYAYLAGRLLETRTRFVGDFEKRELTEEEKKKMGFGKLFQQLIVDDASGTEQKIKIDQYLYPECEPVVEAIEGNGKMLLAFVRPDPNWRTLSAVFVVDLVKLLRCHDDPSAKLSVWERIALGRHPAKEYPWRSDSEKSRALRWTKKTAFEATGVVAHVRERTDKNKRLMAWFQLVGASNAMEVMSFGRSWPSFKPHVKSGELVTLKLEAMRDGGVALDVKSGGVTLRRKSPSGKDVVI